MYIYTSANYVYIYICICKLCIYIYLYHVYLSSVFNYKHLHVCTRMPARASWNCPTSVSSFATPQHASRRQRIGIHAARFLARTLAQRISIAGSCDIAEGRGREVLPMSDPLRPRSAKKMLRPMIALLSPQERNAGSGSAREGPGELSPSSCRMAVARGCVKIGGTRARVCGAA